MRPVALFLAVTAAGVVVGLTAVVVAAGNYVTSPYPVSSSAGRSVFTYNGLLVSYPYYEVGPEVLVVGASLILLVAAVVLGAVLGARRVSPSPALGQRQEELL